MQKLCVDCGEPVGDPRALRCPKCLLKINPRQLERFLHKYPQMLSELEEGVDYIVCPICGHHTSSMQYHIKAHNMTKKEFEEQYPNSPYHAKKFLDRLSKRVSGKNNPGYQHGGRLSPWSYKNQFMTKQEVDECKKKAIDSREHNPEGINTRLEYWLKRSNSEEEARELLSKRQSTFSLTKCIEKYGPEEGRKRWKARQDKWLATLNAKSDEEKAEINRKKMQPHITISKPELLLYSTIKEHYDEAVSQFTLSNNNSWYVYDIRYKNKIIEFNGDYWHCNPDKWRAEAMIKFPGKEPVPAYEIWNKDRKKIEFAKSSGFDVMVVWESEFKDNPNEVIDRCLEFIGN